MCRKKIYPSVCEDWRRLNLSKNPRYTFFTIKSLLHSHIKFYFCLATFLPLRVSYWCFIKIMNSIVDNVGRTSETCNFLFAWPKTKIEWTGYQIWVWSVISELWSFPLPFFKFIFFVSFSWSNSYACAIPNILDCWVLIIIIITQRRFTGPSVCTK